MKQSKSKEGLLCDHFMGCDVSNESGERVSNDCGSVQCNQTVQNNSPTFVVSPNKISHSSNSTADIVLSRTVDTTPKRHEIPREEDVIVDIVMFIQTLHSKPFLREVEDELAWTRTYEPIFGSIYHFIARHPDIFLLTVNEEEDCYVSVLRYNEYSKSRGALMYTSGKVLHKRKKQAPPSASRTKGIVCSACVAERIDLVLLQRMYKRLDYTTTLCNGVLHVTNVTTTNYGTCNQQFSASDFRERFDLFVYSFGSFVWWGTDSQQIKTIHNDYLRHGASEAYATFTRPFPPVVIDSLFPIWGTYEVNTASLRKCEDANDAFENGNPTTRNFEGSLDCNTSTTVDIQEKKRLSDHEEVFTSVESDREDLYTVRKNPFTKSSAFMEPTNTIIPYHTNFSSSVITSNDFLTSKKFQYSLFQDHYILQGEGVGYKQTIAHVIAQSALLDVLEDRISEELTEACSALPIELRDRGYATLSDTQLACIRGKASLYRLNLLGDEACFTAEPEFLWEHPWFTDLYKVLQFHFSISTRVTFLDGKLTAAQEILDTLAEDLTVKHERRLEWTIIVLITLEVILALVELALNYIFGSYR